MFMRLHYERGTWRPRRAVTASGVRALTRIVGKLVRVSWGSTQPRGRTPQTETERERMAYQIGLTLQRKAYDVRLSLQVVAERRHRDEHLYTHNDRMSSDFVAMIYATSSTTNYCEIDHAPSVFSPIEPIATHIRLYSLYRASITTYHARGVRCLVNAEHIPDCRVLLCGREEKSQLRCGG